MSFRPLALVLALVCLAGSASAAASKTAVASAPDSLFIPMWATDLGGEVNDVRVADLNGDGAGEVVASSLYTASYGKSGTIFGLDGRGQNAWKYLAGLLEDTYTTEKGYTVVGSGPYIELVSPSGQEMWKRATRVSASQSITGQKVFGGDVNGDGKDDALVGTSLGMKGSSLHIWDSAGGELADVPFKNLETPSAIYVADLTGDGKREIMVGTLKYVPNTVGGVYQAAYGRPTTFQVIDSSGKTLWSDNYPSSVSAVKACDINGDGNLEALTGSLGMVVAYSPAGGRLWDAKVDGQVFSLDCGSLEGNRSQDVIVGSANVFALSGESGKQLWTYGSGTAYAVKAYDFGGTGYADVIVGSSSVRVVDSKGQMVYRSESMGQVTSVDVGKMGTGGSLISIVAASKDHKVRAIDASDYGQMKSGNYYYGLAEAAYKANDYNMTAYYGLQAQDFYEMAGKGDLKVKAAALVEKAGKFSNGAVYYNLSDYFFRAGDYAQAIEYADKATEEYKRVGETQRLGELDAIRRQAQLIPNAELYINQSRQLFAEGQYGNASEAAAKAKSAYLTLGNDTIVREATEISDKSAAYLEFYRQFDETLRYSSDKNYGNATYHLSLLQAQYSKLNDTSLLPLLENASSMASSIKRDQDVVVYGGIGVVALILLLIIVALALSIVYVVQKGGLSSLKKMLEDKGPSYSRRPEGPQGGSGGLQGLRGKRGESIGDSFKR